MIKFRNLSKYKLVSEIQMDLRLYLTLFMSCTMSTRLRSYIKDVTAYCKKHGLVKSPGHDWIHDSDVFPGMVCFLNASVTLWHHVATPRNDKYSSKVFKYFVEYAETETTKKSHTEKETTTTTGEACCFTFLASLYVYIYIYAFFTSR